MIQQHQRRVTRIANTLLILGFVLMMVVIATASEAATARIKDIVDVEGVRDNQLIGYGLVVGLNGTGDSLTNSPFTQQSLVGMLERLGVNVRDQNLKTANIAAVMVTATLPPFSRQGTKLDVTISALGDATDLMGGTLLVTPLRAADGEIYAVAQGAVTTGAVSGGGNAETVTKNVPTSGRIPAGAIIEREISFALNDMKQVRLSLRNPDFTTAKRVAERINNHTGVSVAEAMDPGTIVVNAAPLNKPVFELITNIEQLTVSPDQPAVVVVDESSGTIVMGQNVRISEVAIAQGNLTIRVTETPQVSQPDPFATVGTTEVVDRTNVDIQEEDNKITVLPEGVSLQELVAGLNALGVTPRDIITILQAIKAAGALQADIKVI